MAAQEKEEDVRCAADGGGHRIQARKWNLWRTVSPNARAPKWSRLELQSGPTKGQKPKMISKWPQPRTKNDPDLGSDNQANQAQFSGRLEEEARSQKPTDYNSTSSRGPTLTRPLGTETREL
ncbi:hypothetical protein U1Q18_026021 [Sarracenia purpurea var. burkii]